MKTVRLKNGRVYEIIPEYALPAEEFYSPEFAAQCMEAPDEVEQHWGYIDGQWVRPEKVPKPKRQPGTEDRIAALESAMLAMMGGADNV